jgi:hypothetical protein
MTPRRATQYLLWYGEKAISGEEPTEEEFEMFVEARSATISIAQRIMRLKPEHYKYTPGESFDELLSKQG